MTKVAAFSFRGRNLVGIVDDADEAVRPFVLSPEAAEQGVVALIEQSDMPKALDPIPISDVDLCAPIPRPRRNIFCVGKNYFEHAHEFARSGFDSSASNGAVPAHPIIFSKVPETVVGPGAEVGFRSGVTSAVDYEVELAVIIGRKGRGIPAKDAMAHVWGYTIVNDVTARDIQQRHSQWFLGKSQDAFCPMGPWVVTRDEIDLDDTNLRCLVNGELRQSANTRDMIFDVPALISVISAGITLYPGDIIATGTPSGVGIGCEPPCYLKDGDVVRLEIDGIGGFENRFVDLDSEAASSELVGDGIGYRDMQDSVLMREENQ